MKNQITKTLLSTAAVMLLTAGAALAQSSNSTAPGPTLQKEPGMASNNLPNPGTPQPQAETAPAPAEQTPPAEPTGTMGTTPTPTDTVDTTTAPTPTTTDTTVDNTAGTTSLPATGSEMPLLGLAGLLALGAGAGLWASRR